ncbi:MAG TPA: hypothetical protein VIG80_11035 [Bacillaceae bacterium]
MAIFVFLLFILNILTILAVVILYMKQSRLSDLEKNQRNSVEEAEDIMSSFLIQMKEENDRFIEQVTSIRAADADTGAKEDKAGDHGKAHPSGQAVQGAAPSYYKQLAAKTYSAVNDPAINPIESGTDGADAGVRNAGGEREEESLKEKVMALSAKGFTHAEIAKKLNKGRTEIELLLKFHQKP